VEASFAGFSGLASASLEPVVLPEAAGLGPLGRLRDGDVVEIVIDRGRHEGRVDLVATADGPLLPEAAKALLASRPPHPGLRPRADLPADTRLWAALQEASGGIWAGCVYDPERIARALDPAREPEP
jgi:dihydroxyacid dehydratase/phosphogluconate dehydratase